MSARITLTVLVALVMVSALGVVASKHHSRQLYHHLQVLRHKQDKLETRWTQLRLEEGAWAGQRRVERIASKRLNMTNPKTFRVVRVRR